MRSLIPTLPISTSPIPTGPTPTSPILAGLVLTALATAVPIVAQSNFSAPASYLNAEGELSVAFTQPFAGTSRHQYVYGPKAMANTARPNLQAVAFRRDAQAGGTHPARVVDVEIVHSHADDSLLVTTFASNYLDPPVTVFTRKPVNLPDHSLAPGSAPAPWTVVMPYDVPWSYNGADGLLLEFKTWNPSITGAYSLDAVQGRPGGVVGSSIYIDTLDQCTTANGGFDVFRQDPRHDPTTGQVTYGAYARRGATNAASALVIGLNQAMPGVFCATLYANPIVVTLAMMSNAVGTIGDPANPDLFAAAFRGPVSANFQFVCLDAAHPYGLALSDAVAMSVRQEVALEVYRISTTGSATAATGGAVDSTWVPVVRFTN